MRSRRRAGVKGLGDDRSVRVVGMVMVLRRRARDSVQKLLVDVGLGRCFCDRPALSLRAIRHDPQYDPLDACL